MFDHSGAHKVHANQLDTFRLISGMKTGLFDGKSGKRTRPEIYNVF